MLFKLLYAKLPQPEFSFAARERAVFAWQAVERPVFRFADQAQVTPQLRWASLPQPAFAFAGVPRAQLAFVPFDVELYRLLEVLIAELEGSAPAVFAPYGQLAARMQGQAAITAGGFGVLQASLQGATPLQISASGKLRAHLRGSGEMSVGGQGRLAFRSRGSASLVVSPTGRLAARFKGVANITAAAQGRMVMQLRGSAPMVLSPTAVPAQPLFLSGSAAVFMNPTGRAAAALRGQAEAFLSASGMLRARMTGQAPASITPTGALRSRMKGAASMQILPQGILRRRLIGSAAVTVSPTGTLTLGGGSPPQTQTTVVRVDAVGDFRGVFGTSYQTADDSIRVGYSSGSGASRSLMRFPLPLPRNAIINTALLRLSLSTLQGSGPYGTIGVVNNTNQPAPSSTTIIDAGVAARFSTTPLPALGINQISLPADIQTLLSQPGWNPGQYIAFAAEGTVADSGQQANVQGLYTQFTTTVNADRPMLTIEWSYPSLNALTLSTTSVYDDTLTNEVVAAIGGTNGGTLSVNDPSGQFTTQGTNLVAQANLVAGSYPISITETLAGSPNSPRTTSFTITVSAAPKFRFTGAATGTTTATIPTHRAGDIIFAFAFRDGSTALPTIPTGWTVINNPAGANTCSHVLVYRVATASNTTTGTFTNATSLVVQVYRPKSGTTIAIGASNALTGTAATVSYNGMAMQVTDGTSWVIAFAGHRSTNTALETPPQGTVLRANVTDATDEASGFDTNGGVSAWNLVNVAAGGTASGWRTVVAEIKVT